ncbi:MAG: hypothetical protein LC785_14295 [Acidobacteria bacterium]|nr:hypothetical protein [Acidobacteriota bacterium]MCA1643084.1 hypothetical protein [Acidobacteriota bacterium]
MFFLIEYERTGGKLITFRKFDDVERGSAENARLEIELELNRRGVKREVVLLDAETEAALRRTHRRYFENLTELVTTP